MRSALDRLTRWLDGLPEDVPRTLLAVALTVAVVTLTLVPRLAGVERDVDRLRARVTVLEEAERVAALEARLDDVEELVIGNLELIERAVDLIGDALELRLITEAEAEHP
jgi:hypothetical protein